jgi:integrase
MPRTLESINDRISGSGVRVEKKGNKLYLVSVLPPRSGEGKAKQQKIALKISDRTPLELEQAEGRALELLSQKIKGEFSWSKWRQGNGEAIAQVENLGTLIERYKLDRTISGMTPDQWAREWEFLKRLPMESRPTKEAFLDVVARSVPNTATRKEYVTRFNRLIKWAELDIDLSPYQSNYSASRVKPRQLPTDEMIEQTRDWIISVDRGRIQRQALTWQWVYGVLAAYGLRPHEVMFCRISSTPPYACHVTEGKTGKRTVYPFHPHWVEQWKLWEMNKPNVRCDRAHRKVGQSVTDSLRRYGVNLPYNLRHAYSLRAHVKYNTPPRVVAGLMGHTVAVWQKTYSRWLRDDDLLSSYMRSISGES